MTSSSTSCAGSSGAEIEIRPLAVLLGENNTNKTCGAYPSGTSSSSGTNVFYGPAPTTSSSGAGGTGGTASTSTSGSGSGAGGGDGGTSDDGG